MRNPLITECDRLSLQGYHPEAVFVMSRGSGQWEGMVILHDFVHPFEGLRLNAKNLPQGIIVGGFERVPNYHFDLDGSRRQIEIWVDELGVYSDAVDWAHFDPIDEYLVKPNRWAVDLLPQIKTLVSGRTVLADKEDGRHFGYQKRRKHQKRGVYPQVGVPIDRRNRSATWIRACQSAYYQELNLSNV